MPEAPRPHLRPGHAPRALKFPAMGMTRIVRVYAGLDIGHVGLEKEGRAGCVSRWEGGCLV